MHFRPFSVKKISDFSDFFPISTLFQIFSPIFFDDLLNIGLLPPPIKPPIPPGPPLSFFIKNKEKIGFPMPTPKNEFQIFNLHLKKHVFKKIPFFNVLLPKFYRNFELLVKRVMQFLLGQRLFNNNIFCTT